MNFTPRLIFWELTKRCNLRCVHCRAEAGESSSNELSFGEISRVIDEIASFAKPILVLTGGEPLYRPDLFEIAAHARDRGLRTALATNGTLIDEEITRKIKGAGMARVSISIDGSNAATHDRFRGIDGSFGLALRGAELLHSAGIEFQFNTTVTKNNVAELEHIIALALDKGAKALHFFLLVPVGCGIEIADSEMLSKEKYEEILNQIYEWTINKPIELKATCAPHYYRIFRQRSGAEKSGSEKNDMSAMTRGCLAGTGVMFISHRGEVQPCGYLPVSVGNVKEKFIKDIWNDSALFASLRDFNRLAGKCGLCEFSGVCGGCRARAFYRSGDYLDEEPYCVYIPQRLRN